MYDIKPLEEEWRQYGKNKRKPYYIFLLVILLLGSIASMIFFKGKYTSFFSIPSVTKDGTLSHTMKKERPLLIDEPLHSVQEHEKEVIKIIKPPRVVERSEYVENDIPALPVVENIPVLDKVPNRIVTKQKQYKPNIKQGVIKKPRKKMHLNIVKSSNVSAYKDVEKRFMQSHDTDDSLFLAKSYFRKGNYKKSEYWAFQTNKINSNIEESWLIFIKSKVKLGHKNEAMRILTNYAKKSNSSAAWNLLLKLKK